MGTVAHHRDKARYFLHRARDATPAAAAGPRPQHDAGPGPGQTPDAAAAVSPQMLESADALRRAASHAATALNVHAGFRHNTRRRLSFGLQAAIMTGRFSRSHYKTFRQTCTLEAALQAPDSAVAAKAAFAVRRLRRRVSAFINAVAALLDGGAKVVRPAQRWLRLAINGPAENRPYIIPPGPWPPTPPIPRLEPGFYANTT